MPPKIHRRQPFQINEAFKVTAKNLNHENHAKKRVIVTFIYLMIFLQIVGRLKKQNVHVGLCKRTGASLQSKSANKANNTQAAHQLLCEIKVDDMYLFECQKLQMTFLEKHAIVYCTSAVSIVDESYNTADGLIEKTSRKEIPVIAQAISDGKTFLSGELWDKVVHIFRLACEVGLEDPNEKIRTNDVTTVLTSYQATAEKLLQSRSKMEKYDAEYWINLILKFGYGYESSKIIELIVSEIRAGGWK
jgi:hypothetical protein